MYAETPGCMYVDFGCKSMERLGENHAVAGCIYMETVGCMYADFGCKSMELLGACMRLVVGCIVSGCWVHLCGC